MRARAESSGSPHSMYTSAYRAPTSSCECRGAAEIQRNARLSRRPHRQRRAFDVIELALEI